MMPPAVFSSVGSMRITMLNSMGRSPLSFVIRLVSIGIANGFVCHLGNCFVGVGAGPQLVQGGLAGDAVIPADTPPLRLVRSCGGQMRPHHVARDRIVQPASEVVTGGRHYAAACNPALKPSIWTFAASSA